MEAHGGLSTLGGSVVSKDGFVGLELSDGRHLSYERAGAGPLVVCHPGGPGFAGGQVASLGRECPDLQLLLVNPRGTADSDPPDDGDYSLHGYARDLEELRAHLGLEAMLLFGHSHGGFVAARYAASHPDHLAAVVLDATPLRTADVRFPTNGIEGYFSRYDDAAQQYVAEHLASGFEPAGAWFAAHEMPSLDLTDDLRAIQSPCLVLGGADDFATGERSVQAVASMIGKGQSAVIEHAGHFAWLDQPEPYGEVLSAFVRAHSH